MADAFGGTLTQVKKICADLHAAGVGLVAGTADRSAHLRDELHIIELRKAVRVAHYLAAARTAEISEQQQQLDAKTVQVSSSVVNRPAAVFSCLL